MDIRKLQRAIVDGLEDVKAQDILVFNTEHLSPLFERVIVASGTSNRQTKALASAVREAVKDAGFPVLATEGGDNGEWIIVDCGAAVAHIMQPAIRDYYRLEEIWGGKPVKLKLGGPAKGLVKASEPEEEDLAAAPKPKAAAKKAPAKDALAKKAPAKKAPAKKVAAKAPAAKTSSRMLAAPSTPARKAAAAKTVAPTTNAQRAAAAAAKAAAAKKAAAKKAPAKKTAAKGAARKTAAVKAAPVKTIVVKPVARKTGAKAPSGSVRKAAPKLR